MARKFQEAMLARQIEQALSKDEILAIYLNHVYFGHRNYGIEQAALFYFSVHAKDYPSTKPQHSQASYNPPNASRPSNT